MSIHALERLRERYDRDITFEDMRSLERSIIRGEAKLCKRPHPRAIEYLVSLAGRRFRVVVAEGTNRIITALPLKGGKTKDKAKSIWRNGRIYKAGFNG